MKKLAMGAGPSQFFRVCTIHATDLNNTSRAVLFETPLTECEEILFVLAACVSWCRFEKFDRLEQHFSG